MIELYTKKIIVSFLMLLMCGFADTKIKKESELKTPKNKAWEEAQKDKQYKTWLYENQELVINENIVVGIISECSSTMQMRSKYIFWTFSCKISSLGWSPKAKEQWIRLYFADKNGEELNVFQFPIRFECWMNNTPIYKKERIIANSVQFEEIEKSYMVPEGSWWKMCKKI